MCSIDLQPCLWFFEDRINASSSNQYEADSALWHKKLALICTLRHCSFCLTFGHYASLASPNYCHIFATPSVPAYKLSPFSIRSLFSLLAVFFFITLVSRVMLFCLLLFCFSGSLFLFLGVSCELRSQTRRIELLSACQAIQFHELVWYHWDWYTSSLLCEQSTRNHSVRNC